MSEHTPGPWGVRIERNAIGSTVVGNEDRSVAGVFRHGIKQTERTANLRLIMAAPELLAAAKKVLESGTLPSALAVALSRAIETAERGDGAVIEAKPYVPYAEQAPSGDDTLFDDEGPAPWSES